MSHEFDSGFVVRQPAWHGLATVLDDYPATRDEARHLAGLDWEPIREPQFRYAWVDGHRTDTLEQVEGTDFIVRSDTGAVLDSGAAGTYSTVSNAELFEIAEAVINVGRDQQLTEVHYETAGGLDGGKRVYALINLGNVDLPGDPSQHRRYMMIGNSHNRSTSLRVVGTNVRVVCANTERAADADGKADNTAYVFHHTNNINTRLAAARDAIAGVYAQTEGIYKRARYLLAQQINAAQRTEFVRRFAVERTLTRLDLNGRDLDATMASPRVLHAVNATADQLEQILASETCAGIANTAYGLTQAAVEYLDHFRPVKGSDGAEQIFKRTMFRTEPQKPLAQRIADDVIAGHFEITSPRLLVPVS